MSKSDLDEELRAIAASTQRLLEDPALTPEQTQKLLADFLGALERDPTRLEAELQRIQEEGRRMIKGDGSHGGE